MTTPYRDAPATRPGLADRDTSAQTGKAVIGCLAALGVGLSAMVSIPMVLIALLERSEGSRDWTVFLIVAASTPCFVAFTFVASAPLVYLRNRMIGGRDGGILEALRAGMGGTPVTPPWWALGAPPGLLVEVDGAPARLTAYVLQRSAKSAALMAMIEEPWAKTGATELFGGLRIRLTMVTNQRVPYRLALVSRTKLAGLGTGFAKLQPVRLPGVEERIAGYSDAPERAAGALSDPHVVAAIQQVIESNLPYITQLSFEPDGARWMSLATSRTDPATMAWRVRQMGWIAQRLAAA